MCPCVVGGLNGLVMGARFRVGIKVDSRLVYGTFRVGW